jgi:adenine deaminase
VAELTEFGNVLGYEGICAAIAATHDQPIRLYLTVPPLVALLPHLEIFTPTLAQYRELLSRPEILGLGELYWTQLLAGDDRLLSLIELTHQSGKVVEGHGAGARGRRLQAYAVAGVSSDHEPITAEEGLERLRAGQTFMARHGEIRQDLEVLAAAWQQTADLRRITLVTDTIGAESLLEDGYLERNVQRAIDLGLEPARAVQMATINVAEHFKIGADVGSITPGRYADLLVVPDERTIKPGLVLCGGRLVAENGKLLQEPRKVNWPSAFFSSVHRSHLPEPGDFRVTADARGSVRVRAIHCRTGLVTEEAELELPVVDGELHADPASGVLKVVAIDRAFGTDGIFTGFITSYGLQRGAVASTMTWDSPLIVGISADERDLELAVARLFQTQGGAAVYLDGSLKAELQAPLAGLASEAPLASIASDLGQLRSTLHALGAVWPNPLLTLDVLTTASIPFFRITDRGYVNLKTGDHVGLFV